MRWARHGGRRGVSEVVAALLLVAIVVGLAVVVAAFAGSTLEGLGGGVDGLLSSQASAAAQHLVVEHAAFTFATTLLVSPLALDGSATNQVAGSSTSIAASLTTSSASDVVVAYVSPADTGATAPPAVSGLSGGGLSWHHRATAPSETYTISYYVPVTITNNQASATPNPFQQKVTWNPSSYSAYEASDLGNVRFCADTACNTPLYAWLESCAGTCGPAATLATAWVQLTTSIAGSGGTLTVYMVFQPTSTEFDGVYWGEAPNLSATYGQYDNGANVFTQYGGKSWSSFTTIGGTWDTTNGYLEQTSTTGSYNGGPAAVIETSSYAASGSYVIDTAFSYTAQATPRVGVITVATPSGGDVYGYRFIGQQSNNGAGFISFLNDLTAWVVNSAYSGSTATSYTMEVVDSAGTWSGTLFSGYGTSGTSLTTMGAAAYTSNNNAGAATGYVGVSAGYYTGTTVVGNPAAFQWFAMRALPPGGVMPSSSAGSLSTVSDTTDLEEWYAVAPSPLAAASITATLSSADTAATWIAVFGVSGANTTSPFDPCTGCSGGAAPQTGSGSSVQTSISTSNPNDMLLFGCSAQAGGMAAGFTRVFSNSYSPNPGELVGYDTVSAVQSSTVASCGGAGTYGTQISDAIVAHVSGTTAGASLYVRNTGTATATLVSIYIVDQSTGALVGQFPLSRTLVPGALVEVPSSTLTFIPSQGNTYSFAVTSSTGYSVTLDARAS